MGRHMLDGPSPVPSPLVDELIQGVPALHLDTDTESVVSELLQTPSTQEVCHDSVSVLWLSALC